MTQQQEDLSANLLTHRLPCATFLYMETKWTRIEDGYAKGTARLYDNGKGVGPSKDSGRWAVEVDGRWIANADTLAEAKKLAEA